jgi:hypothetical protein
MTTWDLIIALFYHVDEQLHDMPKHPEAHLWPSEVVTLGVLHALKGVGNRAFHRWLTRDYRPLFPRLPERTRLFRLFKTHQAWTQAFLATPTVLGVIDTYGIELIHPMREGRSPYSQNIQTASFSVPEQRPERTLLLSAVPPPHHQPDTALTINRPVSSRISLQCSPTVSSRRSTSSAVIPWGGWT